MASYSFDLAVDSFKKKALCLGVNTHEILRGYASVVECLALFDPSMVLVHRVCRLIRDYVRTRPDTMRTIIAFITTEKVILYLWHNIEHTFCMLDALFLLQPGSSESTANAQRLTLLLTMVEQEAAAAAVPTTSDDGTSTGSGARVNDEYVLYSDKGI